MIYQSDALSVKRLDGDIAELNFDLQGESVNKFDNATVTSLTAALDALEAESGIKGLLVTSAKPVFIVGADITEFTSLFGATQEEIKPFTSSNNKNFNRIAALPYPSAVAINGFAMGGGLEVALACDIRIAESHAALALPEAKVGLLPCAGGTQRLAQLVGEGWAKRIMLCGERVSAEKAMTLGLVEEVVASGTSLAAAIDLAKRASDQSPTSIAACKRLIHSARDITIGAGLVAERDEFVALFKTEDQKEGVNAFLERRAPEWKNR